jgi:hypothetical protein
MNALSVTLKAKEGMDEHRNGGELKKKGGRGVTGAEERIRRHGSI